YPLTTIILTSGYRSFIAFNKRGPSNPGILMSVTTRSGLSSSIPAKPELPSSASPAISKPSASHLPNALTTSRDHGSSSTISTRYMFVLSSPFKRQRDGDQRSFAFFAEDAHAIS